MRPIMPLLFVAIASFTATTSQAGTVPHATRSAAAMRPKITAKAARAAAQAKVPMGKVKTYEVERENGHLIYSFEFVAPGKSGIDEVNVDAMSGAVLAVSHEGPKAERKEAAKEKTEASATAR